MRRSTEPRTETNYTLLTQCLVSESSGAGDWWKKEMKYGSKSQGWVFSALVCCSASRAKCCFISRHFLCLCSRYTLSYSCLWIWLKWKMKAAGDGKQHHYLVAVIVMTYSLIISWLFVCVLIQTVKRCVWKDTDRATSEQNQNASQSEDLGPSFQIMHLKNVGIS